MKKVNEGNFKRLGICKRRKEESDLDIEEEELSFLGYCMVVCFLVFERGFEVVVMLM